MASMPRFIFFTATTLNGFLATADNSLEWLFAVDPPEPEHFARFMDGIGVLVEGSTTYEWMLREERMLDEPQRWTDFHGERPTFVFTSRQLPVPNGIDIRFTAGTVTDAAPAIVAAAGDRNVWIVGGGDLAGQFFDAGLLDELQVSVAPATLAAGAPLLPRDIGSETLHLRSVEQRGQFAHLTFDVRPQP
jgi:dihydrofolate reductase